MDFGNTGGMRSPFSPRVRQSITGRRPTGLSSAKKNQNTFLSSPGQQTGEVIYKTPTSTVETYGLPLPVMVTETLTFASGEVTVRLSPCGWCWLVAGRRILAWPREHAAPAGVGSPAPAAPSAARELTLPQTDLAHKADLVVLFYENGSQMPSCIGVSPEGIVRYWPSVGQEGVYADVSAELAGQECERLGEYSQAGLVLATTTCTVVLLNPAVIDGRATVTCRTLRPPSGWLGGIGRRVSLLFFGSMPAHADTLVGVVVLPDSGADGEECVALVAGGAGGGAAGGAGGGAGGGAAGGGPLLQLWRGAELHEHSLRRPLCDAHAQTLGQHAPGDLNSLEIIALDVRASGNNGLLLLIATVNVARSPEMRYAIARVCVQDASSPRVSSLCALRGWCAAAADAPPRFLPLGSRALLYTHNYLALVSSTVSNDKPDVIDVSSDGDRILGAELCDGVPLLFSKKHGVLALAAADGLASQSALCDSPMGSPCPSDMYDGNLSLYEIDPHEVSMVTTDACGKLKTAFLFHLRRDTAACRAILEELFPSPPPSPPASSPASPPPPSPAEEERDVDALLDRTVLRIATEMLDDIPAGDPRWKPRGHGSAPASIALGSSAALQPAAQLRDKRRALALFVEFLRAAGLAARLGLVTSAESGGVVGTQWALGALAEQLAAALALRRLHQGSDAQLIEAAIYQVVCGGGGGEGGGGEGAEEEPGVQAALRAGALSPADVSYRRVSRTARVLRALARAPAPPDARAAAAHARDTLRVLTVSARPAHSGCIYTRTRRTVPTFRALWERARSLHAPAILTRCSYRYSSYKNAFKTVLSEMHRCRVQWQAQLQCAPPPAPALGPRALLPALVDLHRRALTCKSTETTSPRPSRSPVSHSVPADMDSILSELKLLSSQTAAIPTLLENMRNIQCELAELKSMKDDIVNVKTSVEFVHHAMEDLTTRVTIINSEVETLKKTCDEVSSLRDEVKRINNLYRENEQRLRMNNIEIKGVPVSSSENLFSIVSKIGEIIKCDIIFKYAYQSSSDGEEICDMFAEYFHSNFLTDSSSESMSAGNMQFIVTNQDCIPHSSADIFSIEIHQDEVLKLLKEIKLNNHLEYASQIWNPCYKTYIDRIENIQRKFVSEYGRHCPDATLRAQLCEAAAALADRALADAERTRDDDTHARRHYERMRADLIQPFVEEGQIERAAALAEKFKDFELLIEMCVNSNDMQRLYTYIDKYINEGMAETAFGWLCARDGRCAALLVRALGARYGARLRGWLAARGRRALLALQLLAAARHAPAAAALADLAVHERDSVGRMTTMASLAKLCAAAAAAASDEEAGGAWRAAEARLWLAAQVAALPRALRLRHGLDADDVRVPAPEDLAQMYIESDIKTLTEYDYKKALDLTDYVEDMERRDDLRLRVWCASIKRDTWAAAAAAGDAGAPLLRDKVFFRLIDLVHLMGGDLELLLPPVEDILTAPELAELASDSQFHYLIKYGYECIDTTRNESAVAVEA
ncbi:LOW QUALITY PROTEIN: nuclear pore complex protein Nup133 [Aphomia sociella]